MIAVATRSGLIQLLDAMGQPLITLQAEGGQVSTLTWSPDSSRLAAGGYGEITIWDVSAGSIELALETPEEIAVNPDAHVNSISWSPDGFYLGGVSGNGLPPHVFVWDMRTGQLAFTDSPPHAFSLAWNPDSSRLAVGAMSKIVIYDPITWASVAQIEIEKPEYITALDWSPDGALLAVGRSILPESALVEIWDVTTLQLIQSFSFAENSELIWSVAWSPDGTSLGSASRDGTVRILNPVSGETNILHQDNDNLFAVAWHPDGDRLTYGDVDGVAVMLQVSGTEEHTSPTYTTE